jgi:MinD superfamily P-loop ATPase
MKSPLRIAIASGKGGTGKTTFATNLAYALAETGDRVAYVDCDVEEPNGHLFLKPTIQNGWRVSLPVPEVDESRCTLCGDCGAACRHSAIVPLADKVITFGKLCHGCGGCTLACGERAIREVPRATGVVERGVSGKVEFLQGRLNVGEAMAPPVVRAVVEAAPRHCTVLLDAPPGTSCPAIASVKTSDVVLLVTEPTPFGLNDLRLAVEMVQKLGLPFGVAINRAGTGNEDVYRYCARENIPLIFELQDDRLIAAAYSRGELAVAALPDLMPRFVGLLGRLIALARDTPGPRRQLSRNQDQLTAEPGAELPSEIVQLGRKNDVSELVVISGKGGTGKTSIVASFFALAEQSVVADCDVDASDLHLVLDPTVIDRWPFFGGKTAVIDSARCTGCETCAKLCRFDALRVTTTGGAPTFEVDPTACEGCGVCVDNCPEGAATLVDSLNAQWFVSETRHGPMVHALLGVAQENSGKLVSVVRREALAVAGSQRKQLLLCDGSPGIGCPVIASIAGTHIALIVAEPTVSSLHDLRRVAELCQKLNVKTAICINKADLNSEISDRIEAEAALMGIPILGRIRYDASVTKAQIQRRSVVENANGPAASDLRSLWKRVKAALI